MSQAQDAVLPFAIRGQYIKDFSFENPNPLKFLSEEFNKQPTISVDIQAKAGPVGDKVFEVVLDIQVALKIQLLKPEPFVLLGRLTGSSCCWRLRC